MVLLLITIVVVGLVMGLMAVGVIFSDRCLHGSCGGPTVLGPDGESIACSNCPNHLAEAGESDPVAGVGP